MNLYNRIQQIYRSNRQIILFGLIGFLCYLIGLGQLILFVEWLEVEVNLANIITSVITIFICYWLNVAFVFERGRYARHKEIIAFYAFSFLGLLLNVALLYAMTVYLNIWYVVAKTLVTIAVAVFNFISRKRYVFVQ